MDTLFTTCHRYGRWLRRNTGKLELHRMADDPAGPTPSIASAHPHPHHPRAAQTRRVYAEQTDARRRHPRGFPDDFRRPFHHSAGGADSCRRPVYTVMRPRNRASGPLSPRGKTPQALIDASQQPLDLYVSSARDHSALSCRVDRHRHISAQAAPVPLALGTRPLALIILRISTGRQLRSSSLVIPRWRLYPARCLSFGRGARRSAVAALPAHEAGDMGQSGHCLRNASTTAPSRPSRALSYVLDTRKLATCCLATPNPHVPPHPFVYLRHSSLSTPSLEIPIPVTPTTSNLRIPIPFSSSSSSYLPSLPTFSPFRSIALAPTLSRYTDDPRIAILSTSSPPFSSPALHSLHTTFRPFHVLGHGLHTDARTATLCEHRRPLERSVRRGLLRLRTALATTWKGGAADVGRLAGYRHLFSVGNLGWGRGVGLEDAGAVQARRM
uniref:Uncharacterized protein n=1 Tax=Mycena chlorophos TaxID=658473 RepID=A0ABQ0M0K4_MYCCL|nr:predicted protein [Mycena chlorophos]